MKTESIANTTADGAGLSIGIVLGEFHSVIADGLLRGALKFLRAHGVAESDIAVTRVPGAFEIPLAAQAMARSKKFDALIALGCVIRGETAHFTYVAGTCADGIARVVLDESLPIGFGVLTTDNETQARARAGNSDNKGADAAAAALTMARRLAPLR